MKPQSRLESLLVLYSELHEEHGSSHLTFEIEQIAKLELDMEVVRREIIACCLNVKAIYEEVIIDRYLLTPDKLFAQKGIKVDRPVLVTISTR